MVAESAVSHGTYLHAANPDALQSAARMYQPGQSVFRFGKEGPFLHQGESWSACKPKNCHVAEQSKQNTTQGESLGKFSEVLKVVSSPGKF